MIKKSLLTISIVTILGFVAIGGMSINSHVFATTNDPQNGFGKGASELGKSGEMGTHSSNPDPTDDDHDTPRQGIGNVAKEHNCSVSELGKALSGESSSCQ